MGDKGFEEVNTEAGVHIKVNTNLSERFCKAFTAPCYKSKLFDTIGFIGDTECTSQIPEGTYIFPKDTDMATRLLLEEAAVTFKKLSGKEVSSYVTMNHFQHYWQHINERLSSQYNRVHFCCSTTICWSSIRQSYQP